MMNEPTKEQVSGVGKEDFSTELVQASYTQLLKTQQLYRITVHINYENSSDLIMNVITDEATLRNLFNVAHNDFRNRPEAKQLNITITKEN